MDKKEHWSARLHHALESKQKPSYDLIEEAVAGLLEERKSLTNVLKDMSGIVARMALARMQNNTDEVLREIDAVIAKNVHVVKVGSTATTN